MSAQPPSDIKAPCFSWILCLYLFDQNSDKGLLLDFSKEAGVETHKQVFRNIKSYIYCRKLNEAITVVFRWLIPIYSVPGLKWLCFFLLPIGKIMARRNGFYGSAVLVADKSGITLSLCDLWRTEMNTFLCVSTISIVFPFNLIILTFE